MCVDMCRYGGGSSWCVLYPPAPGSTRQHPAVMTVSIHQDHLPPARLRRLTWHSHASFRGGHLQFSTIWFPHWKKHLCLKSISNHIRPKFVWLTKKGASTSSSKFWNTFFFHDCLCFVFVCVQKHYFRKNCLKRSNWGYVARKVPL